MLLCEVRGCIWLQESRNILYWVYLFIHVLMHDLNFNHMMISIVFVCIYLSKSDGCKLISANHILFIILYHILSSILHLFLVVYFFSLRVLS